MSRVKRLALPQRVVLVVGIGLCLLCAWSWWYVENYTDSVQATADFLRAQRGAPSGETYYEVSSSGWEHRAAPLGLVVLWTSVSIWLLGTSPKASQDGT